MTAAGPRPVRVAVIGAGWAGLAAACEAASRGARVTVYEAAAQPGGRARSVTWRLPDATLTVDNGQHLLVGAYRSTLALLDRLGGSQAALFRRIPLSIELADGRSLRARRLPAPLHLAFGLALARGIDWRTRLDCVRLIGWLQRRGWRIDPALTVEQLLDGARQSEAARELLWRPLCVAALNTRSDEAGAAVFAAVLRDTLGAGRADSDFLVPAQPLGELLPALAQRFLGRHGGELRLRSPVRALAREADGFELFGGAGAERHDAVVLAVPPEPAGRLLSGLAAPGNLAAAGTSLAGHFEYRPITTVYLRWRAPNLPLPALAMLAADPAAGKHGQWLFGHHRGDAGSIAAIVVSADGPHRALDRQALAASCARQVCAAYRLPQPDDSLVIDEKRATFACLPALQRPAPDALARELPGMWLAGDYVDCDYPATLEAAVRSGLAAGELAALNAPRRS